MDLVKWLGITAQWNAGSAHAWCERIDLCDSFLRASVVTGSGHGIGRAYAEELAGYGLKVLIISLGQEDCDEVAKSIGDDRR